MCPTAQRSTHPASLRPATLTNLNLQPAPTPAHAPTPQPAPVSLIVTALLTVLGVLLRPTGADQLAAIEAAGSIALVSNLAFAMAQLPLLIGMLGVAMLTRHGAPWHTIIGGSLAFLGGFCHAVIGDFQLGSVTMAADTANHNVYAALLSSPPPPAFTVLIMAGTIGTALGFVFIGAGLMRAGAAGRCVPYTLWSFVLVEFAGTGLTAWASLASGLLYLAAFGGLAIAVRQSPVNAWIPREAVLGRGAVRERAGCGAGEGGCTGAGCRPDHAQSPPN